MKEKDFEEILIKYPELIEDGLKIVGRQLSIYGRRMDILFEDKLKRKLIVELKVGTIKDEHIGQILSYEGSMLFTEEPSIRVMLIGNRVPPNLKRSLDHHGVAWKEISLSSLREFLLNKQDGEYLIFLEQEALPAELMKRTVPTSGFEQNKQGASISPKNHDGISMAQRQRNQFLLKVASLVKQKDPMIKEINLHKNGTLRVASGKTNITLELWIRKNNNIFIGIETTGTKAKQIIAAIVDKNGNWIMEKTGYSFLNKSGWIEAEIIYDRTKPLDSSIDIFADHYIRLIKTFWSLLKNEQ